jgi:hypothetical protein
MKSFQAQQTVKYLKSDHTLSLLTDKNWVNPTDLSHYY